MTSSGVEYNLDISPYRVEEAYPNGNRIVFIFSSHVGMRKFVDKHEENRKELNESLSNRFRMKFKLSPDFCDVQLYKKIERRGYLIHFNGRRIEWQGKLKYSGLQLEEQT